MIVRPNWGSLLIFGKKSSCPRNWQHRPSNYDSGQTENYPRKLSKTPAGILRSLPVFLTVLLSKTCIVGKKKKNSEPKIKLIPHNCWSSMGIVDFWVLGTGF